MSPWWGDSGDLLRPDQIVVNEGDQPRSPSVQSNSEVCGSTASPVVVADGDVSIGGHGPRKTGRTDVSSVGMETNPTTVEDVHDDQCGQDVDGVVTGDGFCQNVIVPRCTDWRGGMAVIEDISSDDDLSLPDDLDELSE